MPTPKACEARQFSDQMRCEKCSLTWDCNDPEPPECTPALRRREPPECTPTLRRREPPALQNIKPQEPLKAGVAERRFVKVDEHPKAKRQPPADFLALKRKAAKEAAERRGHGVFMHLFCPECGEQHFDRGEWRKKVHITHLCEHCGHTWAPFDYPTAGVTHL